MKCLLLFYGWFGLTDSSSMRLLGGAWDGLTEEDWQWYLGLYAEDPAELARARYANLFLNDLTRDVPHVPKIHCPPYWATTSPMPFPDISNSSCSVMRSQPGSSEPLGFVRFTG